MPGTFLKSVLDFIFMVKNRERKDIILIRVDVAQPRNFSQEFD